MRGLARMRSTRAARSSGASMSAAYTTRTVRSASSAHAVSAGCRARSHAAVSRQRGNDADPALHRRQ